MNIKAVVSDIDGTLVQYCPDLSGLDEADALIAASTIDAISRLHQNGLIVAGVTGRTYEQSRDVLTRLGITGPCVFAGGATIRDLPSGEILYEASLAPHTLIAVKAILLEILGDDYPLDIAPSAKDPNSYNSVWAIVERTKIAIIAEQLAALNDIYHVVNDGAGKQDEVGLLVLQAGVDKGSATKRLLSLLALEKTEVACIGDGANDVLMFEQCGVTFAMGNGEQSLKDQANYIVSDIDKDGFAEAVDIILRL
ncbi:MAG: hydrolase [Candidatus Saccharibacteria bacterium]|nr:hydrolase [Candidatus Saccharibacteria bacterium]